MEENFPDEVKCPICFEIPENEIYQCRNGHTVCSDCSENISQCPQCRVPFETNKIRNRALESLLNTMTIDCPNKSLGCFFKVTRKEYPKHLENCSFGKAEPSAPPLSPTVVKQPKKKVPPPIPKKPQNIQPSISRNSHSGQQLFLPAGQSLSDGSSMEGNTLTYAHTLYSPSVNYSSQIVNVDGPGAFVNQIITGSQGVLVNQRVVGNAYGQGVSIVSQNIIENAHGQGVSMIQSVTRNPNGYESIGEHEEYIACRNKAFRFSSLHNALITGNGGHVIQSGKGSVKFKGNSQTIVQSGASDLEVEGNVEEGITLSGMGSMKIYGNVKGGVILSGMGSIKIHGDVHGNIIASGMGSLTATGKHFNGNICKSGMATVKIKGN